MSKRPIMEQTRSPLFEGMVLEEELAALSLRQVSEKYELDLDRLVYVVEVLNVHRFEELTPEHYAIYERRLRQARSGG